MLPLGAEQCSRAIENLNEKMWLWVLFFDFCFYFETWGQTMGYLGALLLSLLFL